MKISLAWEETEIISQSQFLKQPILMDARKPTHYLNKLVYKIVTDKNKMVNKEKDSKINHAFSLVLQGNQKSNNGKFFFIELFYLIHKK